MRGTLTVAAAGGLAASAAAAGEGPGGPERTEQAAGAGAQAAARRLSGAVHAQFDASKPPSLDDVQHALAQIIRRSGCPTCGLLGIDIRLNAGDPVEVQSNVPVRVSVGR